MTDLTKTISNTLDIKGQAPPSLWGEMVWGVDNWGTNNDSEFLIGKWLSDTLNFATAINLGIRTNRYETLSFTDEITSLILTDADGYTYIFKGVSDLDDRVFPTYTEQTGTDPTYTPVSGSDPVWSAA
jgi:hypothetical protein